MDESKNSQRRVRVVLCRPEGSLNVGSACRAMKNMGLERLTIAGAQGLDTDEVRTMAIHAFPLYQEARRTETLAEALKDVSLACGISRRRGSRRKMISLSPEELAGRIADYQGDGEVALVFGNEQNGLSEEEMALCSLAVHIPSSPGFPSLNLSHAVQVITYALFTHNLQGPASKSISREEADEAAGRFIKALEGLDYFNASISPEQTTVFIRDILSRAALSPRELRRLETLFRRVGYRNGLLAPPKKKGAPP